MNENKWTLYIWLYLVWPLLFQLMKCLISSKDVTQGYQCCPRRTWPSVAQPLLTILVRGRWSTWTGRSLHQLLAPLAWICTERYPLRHLGLLYVRKWGVGGICAHHSEHRWRRNPHRRWCLYLRMLARKTLNFELKKNAV